MSGGRGRKGKCPLSGAVYLSSSNAYSWMFILGSDRFSMLEIENSNFRNQAMFLELNGLAKNMSNQI